MLKQDPTSFRSLPTQEISCDLVVVGGGMAGVCCAITAARSGITVTLIQDRPVLGGNASSEVRLWVLGATTHMGSNNRWAREGGVIDEIMVENTYRNPEGNAVLFDTILLEKVIQEPRITLLLNSAVFEVTKLDPDLITGVKAFNSQNSTLYHVQAPLYCDASGDGVVGFLSGAAFRVGGENPDEFGEKFSEDADFENLLGHSIYFYSKDVGKPVQFIPPSYALKDIERIPRHHSFVPGQDGCHLWWLEWGGQLDTVHDTEAIKWELWKVVYGVWNYIKNSGKFPQAETLTLEWVGLIPGKRESRRFEGDYILSQKDIISRPNHYDAVSYGGWSIDLHPAEGVYSERSGSRHGFSRGIYGIPYRCLYSVNIHNLFLAGRIISATHVAFGSTRVMATCAESAQAVGMAAAICIRDKILPSGLSHPDQVPALQQALLRVGQHIPGVAMRDSKDLCQTASITASSRLVLENLPGNGLTQKMDRDTGQLFPANAGLAPTITLSLDAKASTLLHAELRIARNPDEHTPDRVLDTVEVPVSAGDNQCITLPFQATVDTQRYLFLCIKANELIQLHYSEMRCTGVLGIKHAWTQDPGRDLGVERFEIWTPERRPGGYNLSCRFSPGIDLFGPENVRNGWGRPTFGPNAWVADPNDPCPTLTLRWPDRQTISRIELAFDTDFDHPMETVLMGHPERTMPFCVRRWRILNDRGAVVYQQDDNHQSLALIRLPEPIRVTGLRIELLETHGQAPPALFSVRCYPEKNSGPVP